MSIDALLLDIGGVILTVDWKRSFHTLFPKCSNYDETLSQISNWDVFHSFECGKISPEKFHQLITNKFNSKLIFSEFCIGWNACLVAPLKESCSRFSQANVPIYALSNTNKIHLAYFTKQWNFSFLKKIIASNKIGYRKPSNEFYITALKMLGLDAGQALFIDDLPQNVEAAKSIGLHAHISVNSAQMSNEILTKYKLI